MNNTIKVLEHLETIVQDLRENGETDLRIILNQINSLKEEEQNKTSVPFIDQVEEFNEVMGKGYQNRKTPTIDKADAKFVVNFIKEELEEMEEAIENKDIVEILDGLIDLTYVGTGCGTLVFGLKDKFNEAFNEVQASNLSKVCDNEQEAQDTVIHMFNKTGDKYFYRKVGDKFITYRSFDNKVGKALSYFHPDLKKFFTQEEIDNCKK